MHDKHFSISTLEEHQALEDFAGQTWLYAVAYRTNLRGESDARTWCENRYGARGNNITEDKKTVLLNTEARWCESGQHFRFKDENDAFEFKIQWV